MKPVDSNGPSVARLHWISVTGSANEKLADHPLLLGTNETIGGNGVWSGAEMAGPAVTLSPGPTYADATPPSSDSAARAMLRREIDTVPARRVRLSTLDAPIAPPVQRTDAHGRALLVQAAAWAIIGSILSSFFPISRLATSTS